MYGLRTLDSGKFTKEVTQCPQMPSGGIDLIRINKTPTLEINGSQLNSI